MRFPSNKWGIKARMLLITALPLPMIASLIAWSHFTRLDEIERELQERGNLVASTMAESSQYGVISGNLTYLERTLRGLLQVDRSIYAVEILDFAGKPLIVVSSPDEPAENMQVFEAPIRKELVDVDPFGISDQPHLSDAWDFRQNIRPGAAVGSVRVTMSPTSALESKRNRVLAGTLIAASFMLVASLLAFALARGLTDSLAATIKTVRRIREGDYRPDLPLTAGGEIAELQSSIIEMANSLGELKLDLDGKVKERTEELAKARDRALKADAEKRRLIHKVTNALEEERKNIAIDIHDHLNAAVIVVRIELQRILSLAASVEDALGKSGRPDEETLSRIQQLKKLAESSLEHLKGLYAKARDLVKRLRPEVIDTLGLRDAVDEMVQHYDEIHPHCRFELDVDDGFPKLCGQIAISAFRLIQEALSNVVKHSAASNVKVRLAVGAGQRTLAISVADDGMGFDPSRTEAGIGLIGMRERVYGLKGKLDIRSKVAAGTVIHIELPLPVEAQA
ncbi:MAG TPA: ATP-binding protein [Paucimonas sp.]|nr:ATP-binding protein [Paucimonas sp.]